MKIIVCNKRCGESLLNRMSGVSLRADSALLKTPKPFFVPDDVGAVRGQAYVVYRIGRLGKGIERRFALRYVDGMTIGVDFWANEGALGEMGKNMDGSCAVGEFVEAAELRGPLPSSPCRGGGIRLLRSNCGIQNSELRMKNGNFILFTPHLEWLSEVIEGVSKYMSLRQGDLVFAEAIGGEFEAVPGERIVASVGGREVLDFRLK